MHKYHDSDGQNGPVGSDGSESSAVQFPKIIHVIWAGGHNYMFGEHNPIEIIAAWKKQNPDFEIWLWVDKKSTGAKKSDEERYEKITKHYKKVFDSHGITVKIKDITDGEVSTPLIRYEIDRLRPNYGASSDLLRYLILYKYGGVYLDTDVRPPTAIDALDKTKINAMSLQDFYSKILTTDSHQLHMLYLDHLSQKPNEKISQRELGSFNVKKSERIGNDAFLCSKGNPLMLLIFKQAEENYKSDLLANKFKITNDRSSAIVEGREEDDVLIRMVHGANNRLFHTLNMTGPSHVRRVLNDTEGRCSEMQVVKLKMVSDQEDDVGYRFFKIVDNINVEIKRLRCPSYCLCAPLPENSLGWCKVSINKYSDLEKLKDDLIRTINFEINEFGVLRLEDHLDDFSQAYLMPIDPEKKDHEINEMLSRLKIKPEKIKLAQLTFKHKKVSEFYKSKDIDIKSKTFLRYLDNPALLQNVIRCTLSFGLLERIESLLDKNKTSDEQLACFVNYMLDGIKFIRGCPEKKVIEQFMENSEVYFDIFDKTSSILHSVCGEHFKGKLLGVAQEIELFKKFCAENQKSPLNKSSPNI